MMLRGHNRTASVVKVEWRSIAVASFGHKTCPNTPSICLGIQSLAANCSGSTKSAEQRFCDYRRRVN